jgi:hypothetical protein
MGLSVPKASEWSSTDTRDSGGPPRRFRDRATTPPRRSSSAALTLKNSALRPTGDLGHDAVGVRLGGLAVEMDA